jgi:hypothetical protein
MPNKNSARLIISLQDRAALLQEHLIKRLCTHIRVTKSVFEQYHPKNTRFVCSPLTKQEKLAQKTGCDSLVRSHFSSVRSM